MRPKTVSLVPRETASRPSRTSPVPIRLHGLSPDQTTTGAEGKPYLFCQYVASGPTMEDAGASAGSLAARPGAVAATAESHQLGRRQIHQIHPGAVARIDRSVASGEQRGQERADEVNPIGRGIRGRLVRRELADLRTGESLESAGARVLRETCVTADCRGDLAALGAGAGVHPDRRYGTRQHRLDLIDKRSPGIERSERRGRAGIQIDAAVLLRRSGNRGEAADVDARRDPRHHRVECRCPHERRRHRHSRIRTPEHAMLRAVLRKSFVEGHRLLEDDTAAIGVDLEDDGAEALGAGVEAEIERHQERLRQNSE